MTTATAIDDGFLELIRADPELESVVFDGELLNPDGSRMLAAAAPQRYVVVHVNRGIVTPDRFTGPARRRRKTYWVHSVGISKRQAEKVAERVLFLVLNQRLQIEGWRCDPIRHEASQPVQTDLSAKPARYFGVDQFDLYADPTP